MKKILQIVLAAGGGVMIGAFANQLDTIIGCVCFAIGIVILIVSVTMITDTKYKR